MRKFLISLIDAYRLLLSPIFGSQCRFEPSCSSYARTAIERYGVLKGGRLAAGRLFRCHPYCKGGYDPVP